jgi:hypothetical protein
VLQIRIPKDNFRNHHCNRLPRMPYASEDYADNVLLMPGHTGLIQPWPNPSLRWVSGHLDPSAPVQGLRGCTKVWCWASRGPHLSPAGSHALHLPSTQPSQVQLPPGPLTPMAAQEWRSPYWGCSYALSQMSTSEIRTRAPDLSHISPDMESAQPHIFPPNMSPKFLKLKN